MRRRIVLFVLALLIGASVLPVAAGPPPFSVVIKQQLPGHEFPVIVNQVQPEHIIIYAIDIAQWPDMREMLVELDFRFELLGMGGDGNLIGDGNTFTTGPSPHRPWTGLSIWGKLRAGVSTTQPLTSRFSGQGVAIDPTIPVLPFQHRPLYLPLFLR